MRSPQLNLGGDMLMTCLNYANTAFECLLIPPSNLAVSQLVGSGSKLGNASRAGP